MVNSSAHHVLEVVDWHEVLNDTTEGPEGLLLGHHLQEAPNDKVEALTVADMGVTVGIGRADTLNSIKNLLSKLLLQCILSFILLFVVLEKGLVRKRPRHVNFNLVSVGCRILRVKRRNQGLIIGVTLGK